VPLKHLSDRTSPGPALRHGQVIGRRGIAGLQQPNLTLNHEPARADEASMARLVFYPIAIGLFVLLDMALRAHGH
jgi:hypothetical protein